MIGRKKHAELPERLRALEAAVELAEDRLPEDPVAFARHVTLKADERLRYGTTHTVAALLGATGAGKSSLTNALTGSDVATTGVRRPTTSSSLAVVWGDDDPSPLLDWLEVANRHGAQPVEALDGLILIDVPDHDSVAVSHRLEMERIAEHTDLMVWVTDPEKYADAALHHYLRLLSSHGAVTLVVLNKIDRLTEAERRACQDDLARLLTLDGVDGGRVIAVSATTGEGIEELRSALATAVTERGAVVARLEADVTAAADELLAAAGSQTGADVSKRLEKDLADGLVEAAGIDAVADAVAAGHRRDAAAATGWPFTRWVGRLRPHPLRRLHLGSGSTGRSSLPTPSRAQETRTLSVIRSAADRATADLSEPWPTLVRQAALPDPSLLSDRIDGALASAARDQGGRSPRWWALVGALQLVLALAAVAGGLWLTAIAGVAWLQLPEVPTPEYRNIPIPTGLLIGGVVLGLVLAILSRQLAKVGAKRRAAATRKRAAESVRGVADELVVAPMRAELEAHSQLVGQLRTARGAG